eukprot:787986-Pleurochrysis_carterae.AAC.1
MHARACMRNVTPACWIPVRLAQDFALACTDACPHGPRMHTQIGLEHTPHARVHEGLHATSRVHIC